MYVLILAGRYGSLDSNGKGYTHWEYDRAKELGKLCFSLVLSKRYLNQKVKEEKIEAIDLEFSHPKLEEFRKEVMSKIISEIDNINQIEAEVLKSINRIIKKQHTDLEGWVKGNVLNELKDAQNEINDLRERLDSSRREVIEKTDKLVSFNTKPENTEEVIPEELSQMIKEITVSKDEDDILKSEMDWITKYLLRFGEKNRPEKPNSDNEVRGGGDGKYGMAILNIGKKSVKCDS